MLQLAIEYKSLEVTHIASKHEQGGEQDEGQSLSSSHAVGRRLQYACAGTLEGPRISDTGKYSNKERR